MQAERPEQKGVRRESTALLLIFLALFLLLSLITYHPLDPSFNQAVSQGREVQNGAGLVGSYLGGLLVELFGVGAYAWPLAFLALGMGRLIPNLRPQWWRWIGFILFCHCVVSWSQSEWALANFRIGRISGGGFMGWALYRIGNDYLRSWGAFLLWFFVFLTSIQLLAGATWSAMIKRVSAQLADLIIKKRERNLRKKRREETGPSLEIKDSPPTKDPAPEEKTSSQKTRPAPKPAPTKPPLKVAEKSGQAGPSIETDLPGAVLLSSNPETKEASSKETLNRQAASLASCLADFGVQGEVVRITPGPVVTMFEFKPAPGVKISRIAGLSDDLALALKAMAVRIEAPIPGKDTVGVEIPSQKRQTVNFRELIESDTFAKSKSLLTLALGQDISGRPRAADLAKMPHLLVAGATGAGKSVCLNSILLSILFKALPDEVKLLLVDPKRIEMAVYADLPHLVHPVVTEMSLAKSALDWAVHEMDQRYQNMARLGVRNIEGYNHKLKQLGDKRPDELHDLEPMPFLVIIIDELADLMLTAAKEVEMSVVRLAQLARAAGIHMILATQRPSVDVVTGLIKANFPCRISFQVTSKHDSRTILDSVGAEHLLGKGDMLFKPSGGKIQRLHGAFVSDEDVVSVVDFWKSRRKPDYSLDFSEWGGDSQDGSGLSGQAGGMDNDAKYLEAVDFVTSQGKASISLLQRRFRIGFNRAARYIEQMEMDGLIGPSEGSKPRSVLKGGD